VLLDGFVKTSKNKNKSEYLKDSKKKQKPTRIKEESYLLEEDNDYLDNFDYEENNE